MQHHLRRTAALAAAVALVACSTTRDEIATTDTLGDSLAAATSNVSPAEAQIRVIHAVPGGPAVDIYAGDENAFTGVDFKRVTDYRALGANLPRFRVLQSGAAPSSDALAQNIEVVIDGRYYTLIAMPDDDGEGVDLMAVRDDVMGDDSQAHVRVVNAARGFDDVDVRIEGREDALFTDVDFSSEAGFADVAPGTVTFVVVAEDSNRELVRLNNVALEAGKTLTIVLYQPTASSRRLEALQVPGAEVR
jgi:hypothetical protein